MTKGLKLPLIEMLKAQERAAIKAIVTTALTNINNKGDSLRGTLEADEQDLKSYTSTYNKNITDGLEGQTAQAASDFLSQLPKPELENPVN
ncbi:hypothetical protein [Streptococcus iniae]|uniref:Uncharacterized protein n=1 Tax=Streptococcus iniae TaxID=1346 RepID=A0A3L8GDR5_STRIN|nr:hypothetical protein [Streptococcus iniae]AHY16529.1 hypothetical protein DQ08_08770 [Streptococcus iniae]AHY18393.1 hypothetical protein DW64_08755 [Streptococcus iniae]APD32552.1 hypothetical protein BMF34_08765 [Streptococcus iniae]ASL35522.1 hypothetical protein QMA0248_1751 [Streptococcus iniae]AYB01653.1 hypothetical protein D5R92_04120 [Streptococcus iniae]